ncbi:MAG: class I SAM-dependent methyltransferase [Pseudomonadota bacterium]
MADKETISVYDNEVEAYAKIADTDSLLISLNNFISAVSSGGKVLDLGCGPGNASAHMRRHGFQVDPVDASSEMVKLANTTYDIDARVAMFDDLDAENQYDGIWANFSLLHATKEDFPKHLKQVYDALKPSGVFHIGMKLGDGSKRDRLGRFYAYYTLEELIHNLETIGLGVFAKTTGEEVGLAGDLSPYAIILSRKPGL